jgi:hypothetical protein
VLPRLDPQSKQMRQLPPRETRVCFRLAHHQSSGPLGLSSLGVESRAPVIRALRGYGSFRIILRRSQSMHGTETVSANRRYHEYYTPVKC